MTMSGLTCMYFSTGQVSRLCPSKYKVLLYTETTSRIYSIDYYGRGIHWQLCHSFPRSGSLQFCILSYFDLFWHLPIHQVQSNVLWKRCSDQTRAMHSIQCCNINPVSRTVREVNVTSDIINCYTVCVVHAIDNSLRFGSIQMRPSDYPWIVFCIVHEFVDRIEADSSETTKTVNWKGCSSIMRRICFQVNLIQNTPPVLCKQQTLLGVCCEIT